MINGTYDCSEIAATAGVRSRAKIERWNLIINFIRESDCICSSRDIAESIGINRHLCHDDLTQIVRVVPYVKGFPGAGYIWIDKGLRYVHTNQVEERLADELAFIKEKRITDIYEICDSLNICRSTARLDIITLKSRDSNIQCFSSIGVGYANDAFGHVAKSIKILEMLSQDTPLSITEVEECLGVPRGGAVTAINLLIDSGKISKTKSFGLVLKSDCPASKLSNAGVVAWHYIKQHGHATKAEILEAIKSLKWGKTLNSMQDVVNASENIGVTKSGRYRVFYWKD